MNELRVERIGGTGAIVVTDLTALIRAYYRHPKLAVLARPGGFDAPPPDNDLHRITLDDRRAVHAFGGHTLTPAWAEVPDPPLDTLAALPRRGRVDAVPPTWDAHADAIRQALKGLLCRGRRATSVTKVLHRKRPHLVPIVDTYVRDMIGAPAGAEGSSLDDLMATVTHLAHQAIAQESALATALEVLHDAPGIPRITHLRALDIALWSSHPANRYGLVGDLRLIVTTKGGNP